VLHGWYAICCIHDLQQIQHPDQVGDVQEAIDEYGARCWNTLAEALADLEEDGDFERGIAYGLRKHFELPMSDKSVIRPASDTMDKLKELLSLCKCGVFVSVNEHRDYYNTAEESLDGAEGLECPPEINDDVRAQMIALNTIIRIQFYPDTPIGSYDIWHHDLDAALDQCLARFPERAALRRSEQ
jgi:hypothetical protein